MYVHASHLNGLKSLETVVKAIRLKLVSNIRKH